MHAPRVIILGPPGPGETEGWGRLRRIVRDYPTAAAEIAEGLVTSLLVAGWLFWPSHSFVANGPSRILTALLPPFWPLSETFWYAGLFLGFGLLQAWATLYERRWIRLAAAALLLALYATVFLAYIVGGWRGMVVPLLFATMLKQFWIVLRSPRGEVW